MDLKILWQILVMLFPLKITDFDDANDLGIDNPNPSIIVSDSKGNQCQIIIKKLEE